MANSVNRMTNCNVYVDGLNQMGKAEEVNLPDIKHKMAEHKALGMVGTVEFFAGIEKLEAKIKWNAFYADVCRKAANPFTAVQLQVRGNLETYTASGRTQQVPVVTYLTVQFKNYPLGNFKQHDNVELESNLNVLYVKQEIDGEEVMEFDVLANIFKVDGEDLLATYRANVGG
jgi:P2 family phage contractile tail tube protein